MSTRVGVEFGKTRVAVFAQNLFDKKITLLQLTGSNQPLLVRNNNPRTVGANIIYRW